jgi:hypothetical protein
MLRAWARPSLSAETQTSGHQAAGARMRASGTGRNRAQLIAMALVSTVVSTLAGVAQAQEDRVEAECRNLLHRSVFNCGCTAEFLEDHLGSEQADILLRLWTYGENGGGHDEMLDLYTRYGSEKISDAVMNFHRHRDDLRRYCAQGDGPTISD